MTGEIVAAVALNRPKFGPPMEIANDKGGAPQTREYDRSEACETSTSVCAEPSEDDPETVACC